MEDEREGGMKIKDRRRFDQMGNPKENEESQESSETLSAQQRSASHSDLGHSAQGQKGQQKPNAGARDPASAGFVMEESPAVEDDSAPIDYSSFLLSLATQAMVQLGEMPAPPGVNIPKNLEAARHTIDVIEMLAKKTKGNLSEPERKLTEEILHNLRIGFVRSKNT